MSLFFGEDPIATLPVTSVALRFLKRAEKGFRKRSGLIDCRGFVNMSQ